MKRDTKVWAQGKKHYFFFQKMSFMTASETTHPIVS